MCNVFMHQPLCMLEKLLQIFVCNGFLLPVQFNFLWIEAFLSLYLHIMSWVYLFVNISYYNFLEKIETYLMINRNSFQDW